MKRKQKQRKRYYRKRGTTGQKRHYRKRGTTGQKRQRQRGGFLNIYDFTYAGRYTVNQAAKAAPGGIKQATGEIDKIMESRINQVVKSGETKIERVLHKIIRRVIEDAYKTPFRLLGIFGKKLFNKIKKRVLR